MLDVGDFFNFVGLVRGKHPGLVELIPGHRKGELVVLRIGGVEYLLFKVTSGFDRYWLEFPGTPPVRYAFKPDSFEKILGLM